MGMLKTDASGIHKTMGHIFDDTAIEAIPGCGWAGCERGQREPADRHEATAQNQGPAEHEEPPESHRSTPRPASGPGRPATREPHG